MSAYDLNALSGINASSQGLGVISNNLANSQTVGFKTGRAEFSDMFSGAQRSPGNGVRVGAITQTFTQGTITATGREMDLALDGEGFFVLQDQTGKYGNVYTRNGSFKLDKDGFMTDQGGNRVQGYTLNEALAKEMNPVFNTTLSSINLMDLNKTPRATDEMEFNINLDGQEVANIDPFDIDVTATVGSSQNLLRLTNPEGLMIGPYGGFPDFSTTKTIHDTLGGEHRLTTNFYKRDVVEAVQGLNAFQADYNVYNTAYVNYQNLRAQTIDSETFQRGLVDRYNSLNGTALDPDDPADRTTALNAAQADPADYPSMDGIVASSRSLVSAYSKLNGEFKDAYDPPIPVARDTTIPGLSQLNDADNLANALLVANDRPQLNEDYFNEVEWRKQNDQNEMGEKYSSWIVQYTVENYNERQGRWETSGHRFDQDTGLSTGQAGVIYELRFDTNGDIIGVYEPRDKNNPQGVNLNADMKPTSEQLNSDPNAGDWVKVGGDAGGVKAKLDWIIDSPGTGAVDPLGALDPSTLQIAIDVDFTDMTMYSGDYVLRGVTQNGYRIGDLVGLSTSPSGVIEARYSNGRSIAVAQLAVANFNDLNALEKLGGQMYAESFGSGPATIGRAQTGGMGTINAGALEYSNVDVAGELVKMIQTQRTYQASAQVLSTSQELTRTILNL